MGLDHWLTRGTLDNEREVLVTWRKENWLHNWFLTHCAPRRDPDDQSPIPVRKVDVEELRNTIKRVLKYAKKLMGDKLVAAGPTLLAILLIPFYPKKNDED